MSDKITIHSLICVSVLTLLFAAFTAAQETVTIPLNDLKQLQKVAAEREFYKSSFEDEQKRSAEWKRSSEEWKALFAAEKDRADRVQGGRVDELLKANAGYRDQAAKDQIRLGEQAATIARLKSGRKWWFAAGTAIGAAGGAWLGYKFGSTNITIPGLSNRPASTVAFRF